MSTLQYSNTSVSIGAQEKTRTNTLQYSNMSISTILQDQEETRTLPPGKISISMRCWRYLRKEECLKVKTQVKHLVSCIHKKIWQLHIYRIRHSKKHPILYQVSSWQWLSNIHTVLVIIQVDLSIWHTHILYYKHQMSQNMGDFNYFT